MSKLNSLLKAISAASEAVKLLDLELASANGKPNKKVQKLDKTIGKISDLVQAFAPAPSQRGVSSSARTASSALRGRG